MATGRLIGLVMLAAASAGPTWAADDAAPQGADPATPIERSVRPHHVYLIGPLIVSRPQIDLGQGDGGASGYLLVDNRGGTADRLIGASVAGAEAVVLDGGGAAGPAGIAVPANGRLVLSQQGPHLVIRNIAPPPAPGAQMDGTLVFARAGTLHVSFATSGSTSDEDDQSDPPPDTSQPLQQ